MNSEKWKCKDWRCGWIGVESELVTLTASKDGEELAKLLACPRCLDVESTVIAACYAEGCNREATCGTPTKAGYVWSCGEHQPKEKP